MYCGHCGSPVGDQDAFCNTCGARFLDPAPAAFAPPTAAAAATTVLPAAAPPDAGPPTAFVPLTPSPDRRRWRAFAIGAAFALIAVAGVVAFVALRGDDTSAGPDPTALTVVETTTTARATTTQPPTTPVPTSAAPSTEAPTTVALTEPPTTSLIPATTAAGPTPTVAPITVITAPAPPTSVPATVPATPAATSPRVTTAPRPTTPRTTQPPVTTAATAGNVPRSTSETVSAVHSSATRPDSIDSCGKPTDYSPINVLDGRFDSAWITVGSGGGQSLDFTIRKGVTISTVGLVPGYAKQDPCSGSDRFFDMRRIAEVGWSFDGGDEIIQELDVDSATMQTIDLPAPVGATTVTMTIRVTTPPGTTGFDYAPVSEVTLS